MNKDSVVNLTLSHDEALVFFEWLARLDEGETSHCYDSAEQHVMWILQAQLEKLLVEPFQENYHDVIESARRRIGGREP